MSTATPLIFHPIADAIRPTADPAVWTLIYGNGEPVRGGLMTDYAAESVILRDRDLARTAMHAALAERAELEAALDDIRAATSQGDPVPTECPIHWAPLDADGDCPRSGCRYFAHNDGGRLAKAAVARGIL